MAGAGLGPGDVVAAAVPDIELLTAFLGVNPVCGFAPLNPGLKEGEFESSLRTLAPQALLVPEGPEPPAGRAAKALGIAVYRVRRAAGGEAGLFEIAGLTAKGGPIGEPELSSLALVMLTSATTGRAKGVCMARSHLHEIMGAMFHSLHLDGADRFLSMMPLFHLQGLLSAAGQLMAGGSVACASPFDAGRFSAWAEEYRPTWYTGGPALHRSVLALCREKPEVARRLPLRLVRSIGAALSPALLAELEATFGVPVIEGYGLTEAGTVTTTPLSPYACKPGSAGIRIRPGVEIMDEAGQLLPQGRTGEIVLRGPNVIREYRHDPVATAGAFRNGWFRTGDLGRFDEDGYLFVTGRIKEMINRGGEKILPGEIDEAVLSHPGVADAAAFRIPHPQLGDDVAVAVVPRAGAALDEAEIRSFLTPKLAAFKIPRVIRFVACLPKSATGKPQRASLTEQYAEFRKVCESKCAAVAPRTEDERKLASIWSAALGVPVPSVDSDFFELGGHSLAATRVIARIGEAFGVKLPQDALLGAPTLRQQCDLVRKRCSAGNGVLVIQSEGSSPAFFMVRPLTVFRPLFARLGTERPIVGLPLPAAEQLGGRAGWREIARSLISAMRGYQPAGPYYIGGWCADGVIAFEMAQQLAAEGETVAFLGLFDTPCPAIFRSHSRRRGWRVAWSTLLWQARFQWASLRQLGRKEVPAYVYGRTMALSRHLADGLRTRLGIRRRDSRVWLGDHVPSGMRLRVSTYECRPYSGPLTLFCAEGARSAGFADSPAYGWQPFATQGVSVHSVPGDHITMFLEPNVERLTRLLNSELAGAASPAAATTPLSATGGA